MGASPALALLNASDAGFWTAWAAERGWKLVTPAAAGNNIDARVQALAAAVQNAVVKGEADPAHLYMAGRNEGTASVFYAISRVPDLFAAGIALGGSPQSAVDTGRIFAANFTNTPVLWLSNGAGDEALAGKLKSGGLDVEWRSADAMEVPLLFEWLQDHTRRPYPPEADCETNSPAFARCFWMAPVRFDMNERNDVLPSTRVLAGAAAALDLGGFGYKPEEAGPGIVVSYLPEKYSGPLKMGDRIVEIEGKTVAGARQYRDIMSKYTEEKSVTVMVQRGKNRERLETRVIPQRSDSAPTARVQGRYDPDDKLVLVISRAVTGMQVTIPEEWVGSGLMWNGLSMEKIEKAGCVSLTIETELMHAASCE